ncbi:MAG TPA: PEP-CTERM sorting domain-containing protein [Candidatus Spyradosoma merdigallinarum]|uniref:PEP-CTERM sorting domain-containing protein n=1 Tax=Candidatus Spyradosoma merdigallinarum TaxID=2840950 RepID=A0A9D1T0H3_9BACT|nr:PEP-CTERM sorting domain-containing protein [Candidatus Spyradosoma merdigallinarum]
MWEAGSATLKLDGLTANTEYKVYLFSARANGETNGSVEWTTTATSNVDWSVWKVAGTWVVGTSSSTVQFDGSSDGLNASIVEVFFTTGADETSVSFSTGDNQRFTLNGIVVDQGQTIPEPSAFGLLAGLGALALVASRRRCK